MKLNLLLSMRAHGLSLLQAGILMRLYEGNAYRSDLARALGADDPTINRAAMVLVEKGLAVKRYVSKKAGKESQHALFQLTEDGQNIFRPNYNWDIIMENLIDKIIDWHHNRNLIHGSTDKDQCLKLMQEVGELSDSICKGHDVRDDIGDILVILINIIERHDISINQCLLVAYNDIKDRKGQMVDGVFIKETDLS